MKRFRCVWLILALVLMGVVGFAAEEKPAVILFTNDVHCAVEENIGYAGLAAYENMFREAGHDVLLVDCGDAVQGEPIGSLSEGAYIVEIMNEVGYDAAAVGNHEFDYGVDRFWELVEMAEYPYIACNFVTPLDEKALDGFAVFEAGGIRIGFVGVTTPEALYSSTPKYFQNDKGEYVYNFMEGENGRMIAGAIDRAALAARDAGAEVVVLLAHLGDDITSAPYQSVDLIPMTEHVDAVLDAHAHHVIPAMTVENAAGRDVLLASTGTGLQNVGKLTVSLGNGGFVFETELLSDPVEPDEGVQAFIEGITAEFSEMLEVVVAVSEVNLCTHDPVALNENDQPLRIVRTHETNIGDLCADAYRFVTGADVAFVNGGGIRASIPVGEVTYGDILSVHPFGNTLCVVEVTGQDILDALEFSVRLMPYENGSFQHVSGLTFTVDLSVPTPVVIDPYECFIEFNGDHRRVRDVLVAGEPIDPEKTYTLASHSHLLEDNSSGFTMLDGKPYLEKGTLLDSQVLLTYLTEGLHGVIGKEYENIYGQGRITVVK